MRALAASQLLLALAAGTAIPPPGPGTYCVPGRGAVNPANCSDTLVVHNDSCEASFQPGVPFTDDFPPRYPLVAPRFHICHSCRSENDPCASFYFQGWYHYFYQSHDKGGITGGHAVSRDLVSWQEMPAALWPSEWYISAAVWDFSATVVDGVPTIIAAGVVSPGLKKNESDPESTWCHALAQPLNLSDPKLADWHYPPERNPVLCGTRANKLHPGDSPSNTWRTSGGEYRYVDAHGFVYTSLNFKDWNQAKNASAAPVGSSFPMGCCQDMFELPAICTGCGGTFLGVGNPKAPTQIWTGWPPGTPGAYELVDYDEGPVNSSGIKQVLSLGLPELGLNFSWHDHGQFAATKSFWDPVHSRRIIAGWLGGYDCPRNGPAAVPLQQFKTNSQALLRELRYDPRLRILTSFPIVETEQLRGSAPLGELPEGGVALTSAANHTLVASGANQSEVRMTLKLSPWPTEPTTIGVKVLVADSADAATPSVTIYLVLYPRPAGTKVWGARVVTQRVGWGPNGTLGCGGTAGDFPVIAGEDIELAVYIDNTWIELFVQGGRYAQTLPVPTPALIVPGVASSVKQGVVLFTNSSSAVQVSAAAAYSMRSIWKNETTHDRPVRSAKTDDFDALGRSWCVLGLSECSV
jgi:beta-fructofuranosidase